MPITSPPLVQLKLAVMSDLHCRLSGDSRDSFLEVGALRLPAARHPIQALINLIREQNLRVDALLAPGDLTNKAGQEGLSQGWDFILEVAEELKASRVVPVLGNHDVETHDNTRGPMHMARNLRPGFPFADEGACQSFFSDGFCVLPLTENAQVVAVNTVIDHRDSASAKRGAFDSARIDRMKDRLSGEMISTIRIALMHHHPVLHNPFFFADEDVIPTGSALMRVLREAGCRLVVHGHKHVAHLRVDDNVAVFASGSLSAMLQEFSTSMGNMFHIIDLCATPGDPASLKGTIKSWVFHYGRGWGKANQEYSGFPFLTGFGRRQPIEQIGSNLISLANTSGTSSRIDESAVLQAVPDLLYLTPAELEQIKNILAQNGAELAEHDRGRFNLWRVFNAG